MNPGNAPARGYPHSQNANTSSIQSQSVKKDTTTVGERQASLNASGSHGRREAKSRNAPNGGIQKPTRDNRIDPRQIPRPNFERKVTIYKTKGTKSLIPSSIVPVDVIDDGEASPHFVRMSVKHIPRTKEILKQSGIPFGAFIRPLNPPVRSEQPVPTVDYSKSDGPIRCTRCGGFVGPFTTFEDEGRAWRCNLCEKLNSVPEDYRSALDAYGCRYDRNERVELCRGVVDILVPSMYSIRPSQVPAYVFLADVSPKAIASGLFKSCIENIRACLGTIAGGSRAMFGVVTFDTEVHFYSISSKGEDIPVTVLSEVNDIFAPVPAEAWLAPVQDRQDRIEQLFQLLLDLHASEGAKGLNTGPEYLRNGSAFSAALTAAAYSLGSHGGRILAFQSSLPSLGIGKTSCREEMKVYGRHEETEYWFSDPSLPSYKRLGKFCAENQICVDIISAVEGHGELATLSLVPQKTGGELIHYQSFKGGSAYDEHRLREDIFRLLCSNVALEAVLKIRCSEGLRVFAVHGPGYVKGDASEVNIAAVGEDLTFVATFEYTQDIEDERSNAFLQVSLLHTTLEGKRCVRVMNIQLPLTSQLSSVFRHSDIDTVTNLLCRKSVRQIYEGAKGTEGAPRKLTTIRDSMLSRVIKILYAYRKYCATASSSGQLILPEALKFLPLMSLALAKSVWLRSNNSTCVSPDIRVDERAYFLFLLNGASPALFASTMYPYLFRLDEIKSEHGRPHDPNDDGGSKVNADEVRMPRPEYPSSEHLTEMGLVLLVCGLDMYFWVGRKVLKSTLHDLFGRNTLPSTEEKLQRLHFAPRANPFSKRIHAIINALKKRLAVNMTRFRMHIVKQKSGIDQSGNPDSFVHGEDRFLSLLVEDKSKNGMSHVEMLCHIHKNIQAKMSEF